jgi:hypothetical protein
MHQQRLDGLGAFCFVILLIPAIPFPARADLIAIEPVADNTLYEDASGELSNGAGTAMFAGRNSSLSESIRRAVVRFDVAAAIPAGAVIDSVSLQLTNSAANIDDAEVTLHRLTTDWGVGNSIAGGNQGSGAPAAPGDATWLHTFYDTNFWSAPGGDFDEAVTASAIVGGPGDAIWNSTPSFVADVQSFLDDPLIDFGWIVIGNETEAGTAKRFATREDADAVIRPLLTIEYTPVPEPGSLTLLAMGVAGALAVRRRSIRLSSGHAVFQLSLQEEPTPCVNADRQEETLVTH